MTTEGDIVKSILDWLIKKFFCYKNNTEQSVGAPDIVCIIDGKYLGLVVKAQKKYLTPHQREFKSKVEEADGVYELVRSIEDVAKVINENFA